MTEQDQIERLHRTKARRNLTYLMLFSIVMIFASLLSAYIVSKGSAEYWVHIRIPRPFYWSTAFILVSSVFVQMSLVKVKRGRTKGVPIWLALGLVFGVGFTISQFNGWGELVDRGNIMSFSRVLQPTGVYGEDFTIDRRGVVLDKVGSDYYLPSDVQHARSLNAEMADYVNGASQYFYVLTAAHVAHVAFGLLALAISMAMALKGRYTEGEHTGLWAGALYWHFLGGLWVVILSFLAVVH